MKYPNFKKSWSVGTAWKKEPRGHHLCYIAYNSRFLILPMFREPRLASYLLGYMARNLADERTWIFATGIISQIGDNRETALFYTGRNHAGKNIARLYGIGLFLPFCAIAT